MPWRFIGLGCGDSTCLSSSGLSVSSAGLGFDVRGMILVWREKGVADCALHEIPSVAGGASNPAGGTRASSSAHEIKTLHPADVLVGNHYTGDCGLPPNNVPARSRTKKTYLRIGSQRCWLGWTCCTALGECLTVELLPVSVVRS